MDPGLCPLSKLQIQFWCYEDEVPLCVTCRLYSHHEHEVTRYTDKNEEQLSQLYVAVQDMVNLFDRMKETTKTIENKRKLLLSENKLLKLEVKCS